MKIFTKDILKKLSKDTSELLTEDIMVQCKLFDCMGSSKWFLYEYDPTTQIAQAFVLLGGDIQMSECGSVYIPEITEAIGWRLERDIGFQPTKLETVINTIKAGKHL